MLIGGISPFTGTLTVSAFLFVLSDYIQIYSEKYSKESVIFRGFQHLAIFLNAIAIIFIVVFPFLNLGFEESFYDIIGTTLLLVGLGLSILLIAKKNERKMEEYQAEVRAIIDNHEQFAGQIKEIITSHKEEVKILNESLPHYEELMNSKD